MEELRERCRKLEEVAGQAEYFASLYKVINMCQPIEETLWKI